MIATRSRSTCWHCLRVEDNHQRWSGTGDGYDRLGEHRCDGCGQVAAGDQVSEDPVFTGTTTWQPWDSHAADGLIRLVQWGWAEMVYGRVRDANNHINGATTDDRDDIVLDVVGPTFS